MTPQIPKERLKATVERVRARKARIIKRPNYFGDMQNAADCATRLLELEPWAEKARVVLRMAQWGTEYLCPLCSGPKDVFNKEHAPDCAIAELLQENPANEKKPDNPNGRDGGEVMPIWAEGFLTGFVVTTILVVAIYSWR